MSESERDRRREIDSVCVRERERETERETDRQTDRQTDRHKHTHYSMVRFSRMFRKHQNEAQTVLISPQNSLSQKSHYAVEKVSKL